MGEVRSQRIPEKAWAEGRRGTHHTAQKYIELLLNSRNYWGERTRDSSVSFSHLKTSALQIQGKTMQNKAAEIPV